MTALKVLFWVNGWLTASTMDHNMKSLLESMPEPISPYSMIAGGHVGVSKEDDTGFG